MSITLPLSYFGPIEEYALLQKHGSATYEAKEHFVKQSYRNRCVIYGANGALRLTVPLILKGREKTAMDQIKISYSEKWQAQHWKSIVSAYKNSPYFEFYEHLITPLFLEEHEYLIDLNTKIQKTILSALGMSPTISLTTDFHHETTGDFRAVLHPKKAQLMETPRYIQVFGDKHGFLPNLCILDLLFNEGPAAESYLNSCSYSQN